jgi:hypothetical protein
MLAPRLLPPQLLFLRASKPRPERRNAWDIVFEVKVGIEQTPLRKVLPESAVSVTSEVIGLNEQQIFHSNRLEIDIPDLFPSLLVSTFLPTLSAQVARAASSKIDVYSPTATAPLPSRMH